jgi:putative ABC transport system permease protein
MILLWLKGVLARRSQRLALAGAGIAVATALIAIIGIFAASSARTMTQRALAEVPVDWQIAVLTGIDPQTLMGPLSAAAPVRATHVVGYADVTNFEAATGGTTQVTGAGQVLGIDRDYVKTFPKQVRLLTGDLDGVLIAQQTAANLRVTIGDRVSIMRDGEVPVRVKIEGVIDLPNADAMFQVIGPAKGPAPTAPPDNVVLLPMDFWTKTFAAAPEKYSSNNRIEIHVALDHTRFPGDPEAAYVDATGKVKNFEIRAAGAAAVGDNLSARLGAVREDALYARVLLFFLGMPGVVLAVLLSLAVMASGADRQRREQALLRLRGANTAEVFRIAAVEGGIVALASGFGGVAIAAVLATTVLRVDLASSSVLLWLAVTCASAIGLALAAILLPARIASRERTVVAARAALAPETKPLWDRIRLDMVLLILAAIVFWRTAHTGYQIVLAPEGVPGTAVDYPAFVAPLLFWLGAGLLTVRVCAMALARGRPFLSSALRPLAPRLSATVAASLSRQRRRIARGVALAALAFSFAISTAIFNTTYNAQLYVDAQLTNGADVTVTGNAGVPAGDQIVAIAAVPGIIDAEPMQHRFAYVGNDLQDLYGIDPERIGMATKIANSYFDNRDARATLNRLSKTLDGVLVSQETVNDFQLSLGDTINLRLQNAADHQYHTVPFHFIGVVKEFPTAPRDSFLVANAKYIAEQTDSTAAEIVLAHTTGNPTDGAAAVAAALGPGSPLKITDLAHAARLIESSLTAVDLRALTSIELAFAVFLATAATGLILALGFAERSRTMTILSALGAKPSEIGSFLWSEALLLLLGGILFGSMMGVAVAEILVALLTGVFDPPPEAISMPWGYFGTLVSATSLATIFAVWLARKGSSPDPGSILRRAE